MTSPTTGRPSVQIVEEGMREGMQIESASIAPADKIRLLDALSRTGLKHIVVGSFVSPRWTPQMAHVEEVIEGFTPVEGVEYTALVLNARGGERLQSYVPKITPPDPRRGVSRIHLCDVFVQRNTNRSRQDEIDAVPAIIERAVAGGAEEAMIAVNAAWGSNWLGGFTQEQRMELLRLQHEAWTAAGVPVTGVWIGDPMSWNTPAAVRAQIRAVREEWPGITTFHLHLHDARGMALLSAYVAMEELGPEHTLVIDSAIGGMGGCPYCGNGRYTRMIPTEDLVHLLEAEGVETGIDLAALIEAVVLAEEVVGHELWGKVSKAGPRPTGEDLYAMDMPFVETLEEAQHFRLGPSAYEGALSPWKAPITSPDRDALGLAKDRALADAEVPA